MERVKDARVLGLIEQISIHYTTNISNRFLRPVLLQLPIDKSTWDKIEFLTEKIETHRYQGFHLDELYLQILACVRFIEVAGQIIAPSLKNKLNLTSAGSDKILRDMAVNNFSSNLHVFSDMLQELYNSLVDLDISSTRKNKVPVYKQMEELRSIDRLLGDLKAQEM